MTAIVTYNYSAPEQWDSTGQFSQGPYSDVYSIGATAYQMVTGRKPNPSNTRLLRDAVVPATDAAKGRYSEALLATIDKALRVPVKERYQTAREWLDDLRRHDASAATGGRGVWLALAAVLLLIVGAGTWYVKGRHAATTAAATAQAAAQPAGPAPGSLLRDCPGCPEMVVVGKGEFQQGATGNAAEKDELPRHKVTIGYDFAVGRHEITIAQFREFVNASGYAISSDAACGARRKGTGPERSWKDPGFSQRDDEPVVCVNWFDAAAYAAWLSKVTGHHYRLLSESEWEYAARAGSEALVPWGDDPSKACDYANIGDASYVARTGSKIAAAKCDDQSAFTAAGSPELRKNAFGLHDMLGNVAEWTADCESADYAGAPADGRAVDSPTCQARVYRGGAFNYPLTEVRYSRRETLAPGERKPFIGLRVARDVDAPAPSPSATKAEKPEAKAKADAKNAKAATSAPAHPDASKAAPHGK
jgi:formylglycine-generating enzyme required for sulfatase activity